MSDEIVLNEPVVTQQDRIEYALMTLVFWLSPRVLSGADVNKIDKILSGESDTKVLDWIKR